MTRNHMAATQGRILAVADADRYAIRVPARAIRKYLEPGYLVAMVRYWSRLGVGSYAAFEAARDRTAVPLRRPGAQVPAQRGTGQHHQERKVAPPGQRPRMYLACAGSPGSSVLLPDRT
jgi:hypothetical protein